MARRATHASPLRSVRLPPVRRHGGKMLPGCRAAMRKGGPEPCTTRHDTTAPARGRALPDFILAIDQGTTSTRSIVFDDKLARVATAQEEFPQLYPAPGRVEHDPETI